jgi:DNA-binding CsgD family transcriptional regulator
MAYYDEAGRNSRAITTREREIIKLMAEGYRNKEIADALQMNEEAVREKRGDLMKKLDARSTSSLIECALGSGLISVYEVLESRFSKRNSAAD